jgi:hypothetical protein
VDQSAEEVVAPDRVRGRFTHRLESASESFGGRFRGISCNMRSLTKMATNDTLFTSRACGDPRGIRRGWTRRRTSISTGRPLLGRDARGRVVRRVEGRCTTYRRRPLTRCLSGSAFFVGAAATSPRSDRRDRRPDEGDWPADRTQGDQRPSCSHSRQTLGSEPARPIRNRVNAPVGPRNSCAASPERDGGEE